jgi:molybdate transport system ATP-binding protein
MMDIDIKKRLHLSSGEVDLRIKFSVKEGEFLAISGESGSGKTTLLRIIAGLERASGVIEAFGKRWLGEKEFMPVQKRGVGFVFQNYALFENMSVEENLLYVKRDKKLAKTLLDMVELTNIKSRYPKNLSGGQKQRVALCRAFMGSPKLLLLDEPLSAVDFKLRRELQKRVLDLHREFKTTTIMVSHDMGEIYAMADRLAVLKDGKIVLDRYLKEESNSQNIGALVLDRLDIDGESYIRIDINGAQSLVKVDSSKSYEVGEIVRVDLSLS